MTSISKSTIFSRVISSFNNDCEAIKINVNQIRRNFQKTFKNQENAKSNIEETLIR